MKHRTILAVALLMTVIAGAIVAIVLATGAGDHRDVRIDRDAIERAVNSEN